MPPRRTTRAALQAKRLEEGGGREEKALSDKETAASGKNKRRGGRAGDSDKPRARSGRESGQRKLTPPVLWVRSVALKREGRGASERERRKKKWRRVLAVEERGDRGLMLLVRLQVRACEGV